MRDERPKLLIADDDPEIVSLLIDVLEQDGYQMFVAHDADGAIALALAHEPDLLLLDVMMPGRGGYEVYRELRARAPHYEPAVIFLTGLDQPEDIQQAFALGAVDYIVKPFGIALLRARVRTWLVRLGSQGAQDDLLTAGPNPHPSQPEPQ